MLIGVESLEIEPQSLWIDFSNAFFFSVQTITSIGYGLFSPSNFLSGLISSIEAFVGLVCFAFVTGLLYGRFSKPISNIRFSHKILYCNYRGGKALMFRLVNRRKSMVVLPKIKMDISISKKNENGEYKNLFFSLATQRSQITYLPTSWTVVHPIDENSPLKNYNPLELEKLQAEILILLSYHDDSFNDVLHQAHSYTFNDLKVNYRFKKAFHFNENGKMELDHSMVDNIEKE